MKLCFSTLGCPDWTLDEILSTAKDLGYDSIEVRGISNELYAPKIPAFQGEKAEKLKEKLQRLQKLQDHMKTVNAYYRKHGTMKGFGDLTDEKAAEIDEKVKNGYSWVTVPYAAFQLSNNNAEINRLKKRIAVLEQRDETGFVGWKFEGGEAVANQEENRLQLIFDGKPTEEQRSQLKRWGFRWSPTNRAWQRQLNNNAIYAAGQIGFVRPLDGRTPHELQPHPRLQKKRKNGLER